MRNQSAKSNPRNFTLDPDVTNEVATLGEEVPTLIDNEVRGDVIAKALSAPIDPEDPDELYAGPGEIHEITEALLLKDWDTVPADELPTLPDGYFFDWVKNSAGDDYHKRIIKYEAAVVYDEYSHLSDDVFMLDPTVRHSAKWQEFDFYWGPRDQSDPQLTVAYTNGFVDVKSSGWDDKTRAFQKEGSMVVKGANKLMARPKTISDRRNIEMQRLNDRRMGLRHETNRSELENLASSSDYGRVEDVEMTYSHGGQQDRQSAKQLHIAEQLAIQRNAQRGRKSFAGINAPFQRTIVNGRVINPGVAA